MQAWPATDTMVSLACLRAQGMFVSSYQVKTETLAEELELVI